MTEGRIIFTKKGIDQLVDCPLKLLMFFSNPRILKFEFDNSYSWITSKEVRYKTNVFYPKNPYIIGHQILIEKYLNTIIKGKKLRKEKERKNEKKSKNRNKKKDEDEIQNDEFNEDDVDNLLITKTDGENKIFNCINVKDNLFEINKMVKDKYLFISTIYIEIRTKKNNQENLDKSYFYYHKEGGGDLIQKELTQQLFEKYLSELIIKSKANLNLINLYIINGDFDEEENKDNILNNNDFDYYSTKKILGFDPIIKIDGMMKKILFFIQYLNHAQMLYYLYKEIINHKKFDNVLLINYNKYCGYQIAIYYDEEILIGLDEFKGISKKKSIEENIDIIIKAIQELTKEEVEEKKFDIVLIQSIDDTEKDITPIKIEEKLLEKLKIDNNKNNKNKIQIIKNGKVFNKELAVNSHIFYLDN